MENGISPLQRNQRRKPVLHKLIDNDKVSNLSSPYGFLELGNNIGNIGDILQNFYRSSVKTFRSPTPKLDSPDNYEINNSSDSYVKPLCLEKLRSTNNNFKKSESESPSLFQNRVLSDPLKTNEFKANFFLRLQSTKMENDSPQYKPENIQPVIINKRPTTGNPSKLNDIFYKDILKSSYNRPINNLEDRIKLRPSSRDNADDGLAAHNVMPVIRTPTLTNYYIKSFKSDALIYSPNKSNDTKVSTITTKEPKTQIESGGINSQSLYQKVKKEVEEYRQQKRDISSTVNGINIQPISPEEIFKEKFPAQANLEVKKPLENKDTPQITLSQVNSNSTVASYTYKRPHRPKSVTFSDKIEMRKFFDDNSSSEDDDDNDDDDDQSSVMENSNLDPDESDDFTNDDHGDDDDDSDGDDDKGSVISADDADNYRDSEKCNQNFDSKCNGDVHDNSDGINKESNTSILQSTSNGLNQHTKDDLKPSLSKSLKSNKQFEPSINEDVADDIDDDQNNDSDASDEDDDDADIESDASSNDFNNDVHLSKSSRIDRRQPRPKSCQSSIDHEFRSSSAVSSASTTTISSSGDSSTNGKSPSNACSSAASSSAASTPSINKSKIEIAAAPSSEISTASINASSTSSSNQLIQSRSKSAVTKTQRKSQTEIKLRMKSTMTINDFLELRSCKSTNLCCPLILSKFPHVPPVINFVTDGEKIEQLPWQLRKLLKWRTSLLTPIIVKQTITRSGFRPSRLTTAADDLETTETTDWSLYFGKHMRGPIFKTIKEYQKVNHFPGSFQLGRKDRLWRNIYRMQKEVNRKEFDFIPLTFCLPTDLDLFKQHWEDGGNKYKWIIKPPASARGIGVKVVHKWNQIPKRRPVVVQKYISNPYLINDSKFDLRLYVLVTSLDPLRIYLYDDGLVRFASTKYSNSLKSLYNRYVHLTNYSINKTNVEYCDNSDSGACKGHKWSLKSLWSYMSQRGIHTEHVWQRIKELVVKTVLSAEDSLVGSQQQYTRSAYSVQELFGFDVILDDNLKPWILEVNVSPSLHSDSALDVFIKGGMVKDMFNICGFHLPEPSDVDESGGGGGSTTIHSKSGPSASEEVMVSSSTSSSSTTSNHCSTAGSPVNISAPLTDLYLDRRYWLYHWSDNERTKHKYFLSLLNKHKRFPADSSIPHNILNCITPGDARILLQSFEEYERRGNFERIFPVSSINQSKKLLSCFESVRYSNLLLTACTTKYNKSQLSKLLQSICEKKLHLLSASNGDKIDAKHIWSMAQCNGDS